MCFFYSGYQTNLDLQADRLDGTSTAPDYSLDSHQRRSYQVPAQIPELQGTTTRYACNKYKLSPAFGSGIHWHKTLFSFLLFSFFFKTFFFSLFAESFCLCWPWCLPRKKVGQMRPEYVFAEKFVCCVFKTEWDIGRRLKMAFVGIYTCIVLASVSGIKIFCLHDMISYVLFV